MPNYLSRTSCPPNILPLVLPFTPEAWYFTPVSCVLTSQTYTQLTTRAHHYYHMFTVYAMKQEDNIENPISPCTGEYDPSSSSMEKRQFRFIQLTHPVENIFFCPVQSYLHLEKPPIPSFSSILNWMYLLY